MRLGKVMSDGSFRVSCSSMALPPNCMYVSGRMLRGNGRVAVSLQLSFARGDDDR